MVEVNKCMLSVVVPLYNEVGGLLKFHRSLVGVLEKANLTKYEVIYCDDGSSDGSGELVQAWHAADKSIKLISFSRNFGKENALTAGIAAAKGEAIITLDGDGQHPVELIPKFVEAWQAGSRVVVGVRTNDSGGGLFKLLGSRVFYAVFNKFTSQKLIPGSTDFRLIDASVAQAFLTLPETNRITRGLIDWLGFEVKHIKFEAKSRAGDAPGYSKRMLVRLAMNSIVSLSPMPLYLFGLLGVLITTASLLLGSSVIIEQLLLGDPWGWEFTGTAMLSILVIFLVGIILMSQGLLSLYVSHIHAQSKRRPLYVIDHKNSAGL